MYIHVYFRRPPPETTPKNPWAKKFLEEGNIAHNPQLEVFTVMGSSRPHAVTLFPKESCTCPSTTTCYHILAAKNSIGIEVKTPSSHWNLTELRRKATQWSGKKIRKKEIETRRQ